jgi:salicylate hydroxylase
MGDSSHPTLLYQAQGAAMAVEDGGVLGILLGRLSCLPRFSPSDVSSVLKLFERLRKHRTTTNVRGAIQNQELYHMADGPGQAKRDKALAAVDWVQPCIWNWGDPVYMNEMLGIDCMTDASKSFDIWLQERRHSRSLL